MFALSDADHPEELVNVVTRVTYDSAEYNKNVVDVKRTHDLVRGTLV